ADRVPRCEARQGPEGGAVRGLPELGPDVLGGQPRVRPRFRPRRLPPEARGERAEDEAWSRDEGGDADGPGRLAAAGGVRPRIHRGGPEGGGDRPRRREEGGRRGAPRGELRP